MLLFHLIFYILYVFIFSPACWVFHLQFQRHGFPDVDYDGHEFI